MAMPWTQDKIIHCLVLAILAVCVLLMANVCRMFLIWEVFLPALAFQLFNKTVQSIAHNKQTIIVKWKPLQLALRWSEEETLTTSFFKRADSIPFCMKSYLGYYCRLFGSVETDISLYPATPVYLDANETMRYHQLRFASFAVSLPDELPTGTNPTILARDGYYFDREQKKVRCYACGRNHGCAHVEDCDTERENESFANAPSPPQENELPVAQVFKVVIRPHHEGDSPSSCDVIAVSGATDPDENLGAVGGEESSVDPSSGTGATYP